MIVYFTDRELRILGSASTELPDGIVIIDDEKNEDVESGTRSFSCRLSYSEGNRSEVEKLVDVGNFLLRSSDDEREFYTIVEAEYSTSEQEVSCYCEDAGLDLLNTVVDAYTANSPKNIEQYISMWLPAGWSINNNELGTSKTLSLSWDGDSTLTERLLSIANSFGGEIDFSYDIKGLSVTGRYINLYKERGNKIATEQLRIDDDIESITIKKSVTNLATAYVCSGANGITFSGKSYSSDGKTTHEPAVASDDYQISGKMVQCKSAMEKWSSKLDSDGLLKRKYTYETSNPKTLFSHAVSELKKYINEEINYDIKFRNLPKNIRIGDRVNIIDQKGNLYIEGRILKITRSVIEESVSCTLGEFLIKQSNISEKLIDLQNKINSFDAGETTVVLMIQSSEGESLSSESVSTELNVRISYGETVITEFAALSSLIPGATLVWSKNGVDTHAGVELEGFRMTVPATSGKDMYKCRLEVADE